MQQNKHNENNKKLIAILTLLCFMFTFMPVAVFAEDSTTVVNSNWIDQADTSWYNDTDTTFTITTAQQLAGLAQLVNGGNTFSGKVIKLGADIDLAGKNWTPIGTLTTTTSTFAGEFDGNDKTISNLTINGTEVNSRCGLFSYLTNGANVHDLTLSGVSITSLAKSRVGALAGQIEAGSTVYYITVSSASITNSGDQYTGGLAGSVSGATVSGISLSGITLSNNNSNATTRIGGLCGYAASGATFADVTASNINISANTGLMSLYAGGIVGDAGKSSYTGCHVSGLTLSAQSMDAMGGGFAGRIYSPSATVAFTDCSASGTVSSSVVGGFFGLTYSPTFIMKNCEANVSLTSTSGKHSIGNCNSTTFCLTQSISEGDITWTPSGTPVASVAFTYNTCSYATLQEAADTGADTVTLLSDSTESFTLKRTATEPFTLNLGDYTYNGIIRVRYDVKSIDETNGRGSITVTGTNTDGQILLAAPEGVHGTFDSWCSGNGTREDARETEQNGVTYWQVETGKTYHMHFDDIESGNIEHIGASLREHSFGSLSYGYTELPEAWSLTFTQLENSTFENLAIAGFDVNENHYTVTSNGLTVTVQPKAGLPVGSYSEYIYVNLYDNSSHELSVNFEVTALDSSTTVTMEPTDPAFGDKITLTVNIEKVTTPASRAAIRNWVVFTCGGKELGQARIRYGYYGENGTFVEDNTYTTGIATFEYNTYDGKLSVGENTINVEYGGSINLLGSSGTIIVTLTEKTIDKTEEETVYGATITGPATVDEDGAYVTEDGKIKINNDTFIVTSGTVTVNPDGTVTIPAGAVVTTENGVIITGPATINAGGSVTLTKGGTAKAGDTTVTSTGDPITVNTNGTINIPEDGTVNITISNGTEEGKEIIINGPATVDPTTGIVTVENAGVITLPDGTIVTVTDSAGGKVIVKPDGTITVPANTSVTVKITKEDGTTETIVVTGPASIDKDGNVTISKSENGTANGSIINSNGPTTVPDGFNSVTIPADKLDDVKTDTETGVILPEGSSVTDSTGVTTILPNGGTLTNDTVSTDGPTVIFPAGAAGTVDENGNITIPKDTEAIVKNENGNPIVTVTGPATVDKNTGAVTVGEGGTIVQPNGETIVVTKGEVTVNADGTIKVPSGTTVTVNDKTVTGPATIAADGTVTVNKAPSTGSGGFSGTYNYPVNIGTVEGAKVTFSDNNAVAGETVTITVTPDSGKQVDEVIVTDADGDVITVSKVGDNQYSFVMPAGKVNVAVTTEDIRYDNKIVLQIGNRNVVVNGKAFSNDVAPVIQGDRTLVPIRVIVEALGGEVDWNEATRTVTITIDGKVLTLVIDEMIPGFGQGAIIMDNRTYVPIRYVAEYVSAYVEWIAETQQIVILK